jgi:chromosome segregation ATPase
MAIGAVVGIKYTGDSMTIDERLERLAERHEALTQSVEMHEKRFEEIGEKIRTLAVIAEQNEVRAGEMQGAMTQMQGGMTQMQGAMTRMMESIARLARIAGNHEQRIDSLEV